MILYRLLLGLGVPLLAGLTLAGRLRGRLPPGALAERLGLAPAAPEAPGPRLWLHGASLGELTSARWLLARLCAERPDLRCLVTANSASGRALAAGWGVTAALAPWDGAGAPARVIRRWRPSVLVVIENELWPGRLEAAHAAGVPVVVVGARLSARSAARWRRLPGLAARVLGDLAEVWPQDPDSALRLTGLGLPPDRLRRTVSLKAQAAPLATDPPATAADRADCLLAASTHEGEDGPILDAFLAQRRFSRLILAPRHPDRAPSIAAQIARRGLEVARRSAGAGPGVRVLLADTLGEMDLWYARAGATVIGGTFADKGGHTPYEPAAWGSALLHGPSVANQAAAFAALDRAGAALRLERIEDLAAALETLTPARQAALAQAARLALRPDDATEALVAALLARLPPPQPGSP
jgi:3-deoxy-D-manno-octulosonic-acid transferase